MTLLVVQTWNRWKPVTAILTGSTKSIQFIKKRKKWFWMSQLHRVHLRSSWMSERVSEREDNRQKSAANKKVSFAPFKSSYAAPNEIVMWFFFSIRFIIIILLSLQQNQLSTASKSILFAAAAAGWNLPFLSSFLPSCFLRMHRSVLQVVNLPVLIQFSI